MLELCGFDPRARTTLVVTGEGTVDETTSEGKAPARSCSALRGGGRPLRPLRRASCSRATRVALSGDPARAYADLVTLGTRLGRDLATS